jgi:hypothetical protein
MTEYELFEALRPRYPAREFALFPQVANGTGTNALRHCDALALGLWPSRGLHLHGFELKSWRGDWLRELKNPAKAEDVAKYCHYWWIVAPEKVVELAELPHGWGFLEFSAKRKQLITRARASHRENPEKLDIMFIAGILRKAQDVLTPDSVIAEACKTAKEIGFQEGLNRNRYDSERLLEANKKLAEFEKASGVKIDSWRAGQIGGAVKQVLSAEDFQLKESLLNAAHKIIELLGPDGTV